MIRLVWAVLCRSASVDKTSNSLSMFDVAEELKLLEPITQKGQAPIPLQLVTFWVRTNPSEPTKGVARTRLLLPSGEQIGKSTDHQIDLTAHKRLRSMLTFGSFPIAEAGVHEFVTEISEPGGAWREVSRVPFEIEQQTELAAPNEVH